MRGLAKGRREKAALPSREAQRSFQVWGRERSDARRSSLALLCGRQIERTALPAVQKINHQSDRKPTEESEPVHDRQSGHQEQAGEDGENGSNWSAGSAEGAVALRLAITKD